MSKRKRYIIVITVLLLFTAGFIFVMSSRDAVVSTADSLPFDRVLAEYLVPGFQDLTPEEQDVVSMQFDETIRHVAHVSEYLVLGFLLGALIHLLGGRLWIALVLGVAYAASDEVHQVFVEGRGCQMSDLCFDTAGVMAGVFLVWLIARWRGE
jgi:VanZ family protein